jgi:hypothetical protein
VFRSFVFAPFIFLENHPMSNTSNIITSSIVPEEERLSFIEHTFGLSFPLQIEPFIYHIAGHISHQYDGGYWIYHRLSNGGFFMAPDHNQPFHCICDNGFEGDVFAQTLGVSACLYAFSQLSFSDNNQLSGLCAKHYHLLRDFVPELSEVDEILAMCD